MATRSDGGFSLVEVIVAMFLLGVLSLAVLPLIISVTSLSVTNRDTVTATGYAQAQIAKVRDLHPWNSADTCDQIRAYDPKVAVPPPAIPTATPMPTGSPVSALMIPSVDVVCEPGRGLATVTITIRDGGGAKLSGLATQVPVQP